MDRLIALCGLLFFYCENFGLNFKSFHVQQQYICNFILIDFISLSFLKLSHIEKAQKTQSVFLVEAQIEENLFCFEAMKIKSILNLVSHSKICDSFFYQGI